MAWATNELGQERIYMKEELRNVCNLGTATGLLGVNCYHEYYPFFPGVSERNWTDEWLKQHNEAENTPRNWKGKDYTLYEAKQRQREMERVMRTQREKVDLLKHGHADPDEIMLERCKYQAQLDEYSRFSKRMNLKQERARIYLDMKGRIAPSNGYFANKGRITEEWKQRKVGIKNTIKVAKESENDIENNEKSGKIKVDKVVRGHGTIPKIAKEGMVIDHIGKNEDVDVRTFYGVLGFKEKDIHTTDHGNQKKHPYGKHGEHVHEYTWDNDGKLKEKTIRELTNKERKDNGDIL